MAVHAPGWKVPENESLFATVESQGYFESATTESSIHLLTTKLSRFSFKFKFCIFIFIFLVLIFFIIALIDV
jgi:hypothetical protein